MKKSTKFAALFAAVALLVIGAAMTAFAYGWVNEAGEWKYQLKDGSYAQNEWKPSGSNWYWLDENEVMATEMLVEDDDKLYYVGADGAMVTNQWISFDPEADDKGDIVWRYFQANGKAYKKGDGSKPSWKTINGKKYTFDDNGKMLWGWLNASGEMLYDEDNAENYTWATDGLYYCGTWDDGARVTNNWAQITVYDDETDKKEDKDYWFFFNASGEKLHASGEFDLKTKKINGKNYSFDERGVMQTEWAVASDAEASMADHWKYFDGNGVRYTKGWFQAVPKEAHVPQDYSDDKARWFYGKADGVLANSEIKKINGKWYAFDYQGVMLSGLQLITFGDNQTTGNIDYSKIDRAVKLNKESDDTNGVKNFTWFDGEDVAPLNDHQAIMFFSNDEQNDGSMKTAAQTVDVDGENYAFYFNKNSGDSKGIGLNGLKSNVYYVYGRKVKASSDDKFIIVELTDNTTDATVKRVNVKTSELFDDQTTGDLDQNKYNGSKTGGHWVGTSYYRVVGTSGTYVKSGAKKNGNDVYLNVVGGWLTGLYTKKD